MRNHASLENAEAYIDLGGKKKNRDETEFTLFGRCCFFNDKFSQNKTVIQMVCLSAMWLCKSGVSFGGQIDVPLRELFKCCFSPSLAEPEVPSVLRSAVTLRYSTVAQHCIYTITCLPLREPKGLGEVFTGR